MYWPRGHGGKQTLARPYLADAVHRRHGGIQPQTRVTPGSTEGSVCPRRKVKSQLLGLGIHVHSPEWERICLWEVIRAGLFWTWRSQASGGEMWEKGFLIDSPL